MSDVDDDGYPTEEAEEKIRDWSYLDPRGLLAYVKTLWAFPQYWSETTSEDGELIYQISTAGWSGNEQLINAMVDNEVFWAMCWYSSRRGGHYELRFRPLC